MILFKIVTINDLQVIAKDDKAGLCVYGNLKVYWDDATDTYKYWYKSDVIVKSEAEAFLTGMQK